MLKIIQLGMVPYLARQGMGEVMEVSIDLPDEVSVSASKEKDPWGHWIFEVNANGNMNLESLRKGYSARLGANADHVTEQWRIRLRSYYHYNHNEIQGDDDVFLSVRKRYGSWGTVAYSLGDHWSVGAGINYFSDTYQNIDQHISLAPALEYSIFPYRDVMRREFTIAYRIRGLYQDYAEMTVYNQLNEALVQQEIRADLRLRQPWGMSSLVSRGPAFFTTRASTA